MAYEYVPRSEYTPVREKLEEIILEIQEKMRPEYTFQFVLIGSGSKKLITREKKSNTGFDFDYNFVLKKINPNFDGAQTIREKFFEVIKDIASNHGYKSEDSKTAITIKFVDYKNHKIFHSCDIGIVREYQDEYDDFGQEIIIRDKNSDKPRYIWNKRPQSINHLEKLRNIETAGLWNELRDDYLELKNKNKDPDKKSYQLFIEAVHNLYNKYEWED